MNSRYFWRDVEKEGSGEVRVGPATGTGVWLFKGSQKMVEHFFLDGSSSVFPEIYDRVDYTITMTMPGEEQMKQLAEIGRWTPTSIKLGEEPESGTLYLLEQKNHKGLLYLRLSNCFR